MIEHTFYFFSTNMKAIAGLVLLVAAAAAVENGCPQDQILNWKIEKLLPHKECNKFYKCANGEPVEMICPSILVFNEETSLCDWPSLVDCTGRDLPSTGPEVIAESIGAFQNTTEDDTEQEIESPEDVTTPESSTPVSPELQENGCPVDPLIHWLVPHEEDCTLFYYCVWGEKVLRQCSPYLHFNRDIQVCDYPEEAGCVSSFNKHLSSTSLR